MKKISLIFIVIFYTQFLIAQVGIGTTNPQGALDIFSTNTGLVLPRVTSIETVNDGQGNNAIDGTLVYDLSRNKVCFRINGKWLCMGDDGSGNAGIDFETVPPSIHSAYLKASNTGSLDSFGDAIAISGDGTRIAVGAPSEDSNAVGINGNQADNSASNAGAVYIFAYTSGSWSQEAYIKASNTGAGDTFGSEVSLNYDGSLLAVAASAEDSNATGINGDQTNNSLINSGAVYVFNRSGTTWSQEAYIKASNTGASDFFGGTLSLNDDGNYLAVGSILEDSNATGINGDGTNNSASSSGAVYIFERNLGVWTQQAYIKASNTGTGDEFGYAIELDTDGSTLVVGARGERSSDTGINADQTDNSFTRAGAVYVFERTGTTWSQSTYIKPSVLDNQDQFGFRISISGDGNLIAVGLWPEDSNATGINGNNTDNSASNSGAVYIYEKYSGNWTEEAYIKASNTEAQDYFSYSLKFSSDGTRLIVAAFREESNATGFNGDQTDNSLTDTGAAYSYKRDNGIWTQEAYIKSLDHDAADEFGTRVAISSDGCTIIISSPNEDSNATGVGGDFTNNSIGNSGAVYVIK